MEPVRASDERLDFRVTVRAEWPKQPPGTQNLKETFAEEIDEYEDYYEEEYREYDRHAMRDSGYKDVWRGLEVEDVGPLAWAHVSTTEIRYSVYGVDALSDGYERMVEWYEACADATLEELVGFPRYHAFHCTGIEIEVADGWAVTTDPSKTPRRLHNDGPLVEVGKEPEGDRGLARVGRWEVDYRAEDDGNGFVVFQCGSSPTVVLAEEADEVLADFLTQDRLLVVDEAELDED